MAMIKPAMLKLKMIAAFEEWCEIMSIYMAAKCWVEIIDMNDSKSRICSIKFVLLIVLILDTWVLCSYKIYKLPQILINIY